MSRPSARTVFGDPVHFLAFGAGAGLAPKAPGTVGSLWGVALAWLTAGWALPAQLALLAVLIVAGFGICGESARRLGEHDHPGIVWDEIAGCYLTLLVAGPEPVWLVAGFAAFRLFDIWKPWPIRDLDHRLHGGAGIMLDDVVAGVYGALALAALEWISSTSLS
ncbi:phosphatidylglycerophosphatase A family protein [Lentisalinibacter sediminis]|uniref:phosphatidylglycerophosphatase A family protein n=1 Tax=Lentisalinibacter sediminis TaxID=2992237 RepID=UPI003868CF78